MTCFSQEQIAWANRHEANSSSYVSDAIVQLYRLRCLRRLCLSVCLHLEGGRFFSATLRRILEQHHGVSVGRYSYGPCLVPGALPPGTVIGSYCSIADGLSVHRRNHPPATLTQHPFFYNSELGLLNADTIGRVEENPLVIGNDVWIGDRVTVLPSCHTIANGAVVGAGSIVTRNVAPFTIVVGNPARPIRRRYPDAIIAELQRSEWWNLSLPELLQAGNLLLTPIDLDRLRSFVDVLHARSANGASGTSIQGNI